MFAKQCFSNIAQKGAHILTSDVLSDLVSTRVYVWLQCMPVRRHDLGTETEQHCTTNFADKTAFYWLLTSIAQIKATNYWWSSDISISSRRSPALI